MGRPYARVVLAMLALAACIGLLLRFGLLYGMPSWAANYTAVRHAHSHLMYFGWVQALWIVGVSVLLLALLGAGFVTFTPIVIIGWWRVAAWASVLIAVAAVLASLSLTGRRVGSGHHARS